MVKIKLSTRNFIFTVVHVHQVKTLWLRPCPRSMPRLDLLHGHFQLAARQAKAVKRKAFSSRSSFLVQSYITISLFIQNMEPRIEPMQVSPIRRCQKRKTAIALRTDLQGKLDGQHHSSSMDHSYSITLPFQIISHSNNFGESKFFKFNQIYMTR